MEKKKFSGTRIVFGSAVYMLLIMSVLGLYGPLYGMFPEYFHTDLVGLAWGISACQIVGAVTGMVAGKILRTLKPRKLMIIGGILPIVFGLVMCYWKGSVAGFCVAMGIGGVCCGLCTHGCVTDLIMRWYVEKRASMISFIMAVAMFGTATGQTLTTILYGILGDIGHTMLLASSILGVLIVFIAVFIIRDDPAALGQIPLGADNAGLVPGQEKEEPAGKEKKIDLAEVYKNPVFWCLVVAVCFTNSGASYIAGYLNTFLPTLGVDFSLGATFMSVMGYTAAVTLLVAGKIIDKIGIKKFTYTAMAGAILGNGLLLFLNYNQSALIPVLCGVTVGYSFAYATSTIHNLLCPILFVNSDIATEANTKLIAVVYGASAILGPALSSAIVSGGFPLFYKICLGFNAITLVSFILAFTFAKKRGMKV